MVMRMRLVIIALITCLFGSVGMTFLLFNDISQGTSVFHTYVGYLDTSVEIIKPTAEWAVVETEFGIEINGSGVKVAILDTGIDTAHWDLDDIDDDPLTTDPKIVANVSFVTGEDAADYHGHGTHVAGIIAGTGNRSAGVYTGVAPGAEIMNVKVLNSSAMGEAADIIDGIDYAVTNGANVISMSLGTMQVGDGSDPVSQKIDWAVRQGVPVVVAAGKLEGIYNVTIPGVSKYLSSEDQSVRVGSNTSMS